MTMLIAWGAASIIAAPIIGSIIHLSDSRLHVNQTGRPFIKDWRMKDITEARTQ